jgi:thiosulfate/3-mercaptopyruvate sulfurtransferase
MNFLLSIVLAAGIVGPLDHSIVTPDWLEKNLGDPAVVVVEIGSSATTDHPHIPGARFLRIDSIVREKGWPPDEMPPVDELIRTLEKAGIGDDGRLVIYSANPLYATRAWLVFDYLGQADRTAILDGGFARWSAEKRPLATKRQPHLAKTFTARPAENRLVEHAAVRRAVESGAVFIDARSFNEYRGFKRGAQVTRRGHIPGARTIHWKGNLAKDGSFRTPAELKVLYGNAIQNPDAPVIVYCRTGMEASMPYFVLRSLGYDVSLYDGSFTEWSRDETAAVETMSDR